MRIWFDQSYSNLFCGEWMRTQLHDKPSYGSAKILLWTKNVNILVVGCSLKSLGYLVCRPQWFVLNSLSIQVIRYVKWKPQPAGSVKGKVRGLVLWIWMSVQNFMDQSGRYQEVLLQIKWPNKMTKFGDHHTHHKFSSWHPNQDRCWETG